MSFIFNYNLLCISLPYLDSGAFILSFLCPRLSNILNAPAAVAVVRLKPIRGCNSSPTSTNFNCASAVHLDTTRNSTPEKVKYAAVSYDQPCHMHVRPMVIRD